jgi:uncharacterized protein (TIGR00369 family)
MQKLPGSRNCFVCGRENPKSLRLEFYFDEEAGIVQAEVNLDESHEGFPGVMHGGVIAAILDEAAGRAWGEEPDRFMVTSELKIRYRKPTPVGEALQVKAWPVRRRGRVSMSHSEVQNYAGEILAEAEAVFVDIPSEQVEEMRSQIDGWRVYPDGE